jgi:hypothetical protein
MAASKFYFSDRNGKPLSTEHDGCDAGGTGAFITENGGEMDKQVGAEFKAWRDRKGRPARTRITRQWWNNQTNRYNDDHLTIDDFDGHTAILVKFWCPSGSEYFWLIGSDGCDKIAEQTANRK